MTTLLRRGRRRRCRDSNDDNNDNALFTQKVRADKLCRKLDMYAFTPTYELPSYTSWVGGVMTLFTLVLFANYFFVTLRDYIQTAPDLVEMGFATLHKEADVVTSAPPGVMFTVQYTDSKKMKRTLDASNVDRYFRYKAEYVTIEHQDAVPRKYETLPTVNCQGVESENLICIDWSSVETDNVVLQGRWLSDKYQFVQIELDKCKSDDDVECATDEEIEAAIQRGAIVEFHMESQDFDVNQYNSRRTGSGVVTSEREHRLYFMPGVRLTVEHYMRLRQISTDNRHVGSPPLPQGSMDILSDGETLIVHKPNAYGDDPLARFYVRLHAEYIQEQVQYWLPSLLDLFGLWGAIFSFLTQLSFGLVARLYNRRVSNKSFKHRVKTLASDIERMEHDVTEQRSTRGLTKGPNHNPNKSFRPTRVAAREHDIPDIRLFDHEHFDELGRLNVSAEEFQIPTSVFGELRSFAVQEHRKKRLAAATLSKWIRITRRNRLKKAVSGDASNGGCSRDDEWSDDDSKESWDIESGGNTGGQMPSWRKWADSFRAQAGIIRRD